MPMVEKWRAIVVQDFCYMHGAPVNNSNHRYSCTHYIKHFLLLEMVMALVLPDKTGTQEPQPDSKEMIST